MASTIDTSGIDATKPESVSATTESVRDNFSAIVTQLGNAKTDIETLQDGKQDLDSDLTAIAALAKTDGNIIVGNGTTWVAESGATARTSLGLGTDDSPTFATVDLTGITDGNIPYIGASGFADSPLSTDGTDVTASGKLLVPNQPAFYAYAGSVTTAGNIIVFNNSITNVGSGLNTSTGRYTAGVAGTYKFSATVLRPNGSSVLSRLLLNGAERAVAADTTTTGDTTVSMRAVLELEVGDYIDVDVSTGSAYGGSSRATTFAGHLIG